MVRSFVLLPLILWPGLCSVTNGDNVDEQLQTLIEEAWEFDLEQDPLLATDVGDHRYDDRLPDVSPQAVAARMARKREFLERLQAIERSQLTPTHRVNYDIFRRLLSDELQEYEFHSHLIPITNRSGFHIDFPDLRLRVPMDSVEAVENYVARLRGFDAYVQRHIELMREGIKGQYTLPSVVLAGYREPIEAHIVQDPRHSVFYEPLRTLADSLPQAQRQRLQAEGAEAIAQSIVPGYREFLAFMENEYVPAARGSIAASALPNGRAFYRHRVKRFTTLPLSPEEVHETGMQEVRRIRQQMEQIIAEVQFEGDFAQFIQWLRTDPRFYVSTPDQLLKEVALVLKKMDGQLPALFRTLPRTPYGIRPVPDYIAPRTTSAYYMPPTGDGTRAGFYYINTFDLKSRPLYEIEALSLHEAVPGHHLQIALQQELPDVPAFRRFAPITAFVEGWALYAERLGQEVGFYQDPYSDFGRLTYEMWRACRLVVDTGIHYLGWTRQQAIDFMAQNTALSLHNIRAEVDRYIAWPGQALAYKIGELKIRQLRRAAEERLGDRFDLRAFHDAVLSSGAVPLDVLQQQIESWIEKSGQDPFSSRVERTNE